MPNIKSSITLLSTGAVKPTSESVSKIPQVEASPLRQRLKQRIEENTIEIKEEEPRKQKEKKKSPAKSNKKDAKESQSKKIPKVFASPSWYKSPTQRKIQAKKKKFDELRELLRGDENNTEEGINKIINDLKF
jgi:hypothetical protein